MQRYNNDRSRWLLLINLALTFCGVGQVWLVQLSSYTLWADVGPAEFPAYHIAWWHSIWGVLFIPAGLVVLCTVAMFWLRPPGVPTWAVWLGIALQFLIYGLTAVWWAPLMARLEGTSGPVYGPMYHLLMVTHWGRVALITAYGLLQFWLAARCFLLEKPNNQTLQEPEKRTATPPLTRTSSPQS